MEAAPTAAPSAEPQPAADYRARGAEHHVAARAAERRARWVERARLGIFVAGALAAAWANERWGVATAVGVALGGVAVLAPVIAAHRRARGEAAAHYRLAEVCERGEARVLRRWDRLSAPAVPVAEDHPYAHDLSITGRASLWQLLDTVSAYPGRDTLAAWLLGAPDGAPDGAPPDVAELRARQEAVRALVPATAWRETLAAHALAVGAVRRQHVDAFAAWAAGAPGALARAAPYAAACASPSVLLAAVATAALLPGAAGRAWAVAGAALVVNLALALVLRRTVGPAVRAATQWSGGLRQHAALLRHAAAPPVPGARLDRLAAALRAGGGASRAAARLERIATSGEVRYSPMMYAVVQATLLWDVHVAAAVERWRRDAGRHVGGWFAALGELEALAALATLAHDNPGWAFPELCDAAADAGARFDATALGHPLIAETTRVPNDVVVGPPGTVLLVTGSNMAGKTTLLRAVGVNAVLAQLGGPVCAARLAMPRVRVMTSVTVHDALAENTSLFLAELRRVKRIVDAARAAEAGGAPLPPVLYLLDEVLHGTNSAERRVATRAVVAHLLAARAIGAVSTHDLSLADDEPLASAARLVHFTETVLDTPEGARMTFDYRLRPGLATSTNALVLVRLMGLASP